MSPRERVRVFLDPAAAGDAASLAVDAVLVGLILVNVIALVLETVEPIQAAAPRAFALIEVGSVAVFTVEYLARLWSCTALGRYRHPVGGRIRFALRPMMLIDLLAIAPFYLPFVGIDLRVLRVLRVFRLLRIAKLARYTDGLRSIGNAVAAKRVELLTTLGFLAALLLIASTLMYFAERDAQPDRFGNIPHAMWWALITLTTVGYGDVFPVTVLGRIAGGLIAVLGIGFVALPTGILGSAFVEEVSRRRAAASRRCPYCGRSANVPEH